MSKSTLPFGLTGGVASGKTTVAAFFAELGAKVIDADVIAHDLLNRRGDVYSEVVRCFGRGILGVSGEIDRSRLGAIVFSDADKRRELESILHPRIINTHDQIAREYFRQNPQAVIVVEAALIYEAKVEQHFRNIIVAWCTREQQIERLVAKAAISRADAEVRIASQMPMEAKRRCGDFVIDCSKTLDDTRRQVNALYAQLKQLVTEAAASR